MKDGKKRDILLDREKERVNLYVKYAINDIYNLRRLYPPLRQ